MAHNLNSRRPRTAYAAIRPPVFRKQPNSQSLQPTNSSSRIPPIQDSTVIPTSLPQSSDGDDGDHKAWEKTYEQHLAKIGKQPAQDTHATAQYASNLPRIQAVLAGGLKQQKGEVTPRRMLKKKEEMSSLEFSSASWSEDGSYKDAAMASLRKEIANLRSKLAMQDITIAQLQSTNSELQLTISRQEAALAQQRQVERTLDLRGLQELKLEVLFHRLDKQHLYDIILKLLQTEYAPTQRLQLLQTLLTQKHQLLATFNVDDFADILPTDPSVYCSLPAFITDFFLGRDLGSQVVAHHARGILHSKVWDPEVRAPVGRVAICFIDVPHSLELWETDAETAKVSLLVVHDVIVEHARSFNGFLVHAEGDGWLLIFSFTTDAVLFCTDVTLRLLKANWPPRLLHVEHAANIQDDKGQALWRGLRVRMALHVGQVISEPNPTTNVMEYTGPNLDACSRLCSLAHAGQLLCTDEAFEEVCATIGKPSSPIQFRYLATAPFEGIERPLALYEFFVNELAGRMFPPIEVLHSNKHPGDAVPRRSKGEAMVERWWPQVPEWVDRLNEYQERLRLLLATRQAIHIDIDSMPRQLSDQMVHFFVFFEVERAVPLWRKDALSLAESLELYARLVRQTMANFGCVPVLQNADSYLLSFHEVVPAMQFLIKLHDGLLLLDWPRGLLRHPEASAIVGTDGSTMLWKGLRIRSGCCAGPSAATAKVAMSLNPLLALTQVMLDTCHAGQVVCCERVASMMRTPEVIWKMESDIRVQAFTSVTSLSGKMQPIFNIVTQLLEQRLFFQKARTLVYSSQLRLGTYWQQEETELRGRLDGIERMDAQLQSLPKCASHTPIPINPDVSFVFTHIQGALSLWDFNVPEMLHCMALYITGAREHIAKHGGAEVQVQGDSFWVAFASPLDAVSFTMHLQEVLLDLPWPQKLIRHPDASTILGPNGTVLFKGLRVKMGMTRGKTHVHLDHITGKVLYYGGTVRKAAALAVMAHGGQTLVDSPFIEASDVAEHVQDICSCLPLGTVTMPALRPLTIPVVQLLPLSLATRSFPMQDQSLVRSPNPIETWWRSCDWHAREEPQMSEGGTNDLSLLTIEFTSGGKNILSELCEDVDALTEQPMFLRALKELSSKLRYFHGRLDDQTLQIQAEKTALEERLASRNWSNASWVPEVQLKRKSLKALGNQTQQLADFFHSCLSLVDRLAQATPLLVELELQKVQTMGQSMSSHQASSPVNHEECVPICKHHQALFRLLVMQAMLAASELHRMKLEDDPSLVECEPDALPCTADPTPLLQGSVKGVQKIWQNEMRPRGAAVSFYWMYREIAGFLELMQAYIKAQQGYEGVGNDEDFVHHWISFYNKTYSQEYGIPSPEDSLPAPIQFIHQQQWGSLASHDELPATEDHKKVRQTVISLLLKFFMFVKRAVPHRPSLHAEVALQDNSTPGTPARILHCPSTSSSGADLSSVRNFAS